MPALFFFNRPPQKKDPLSAKPVLVIAFVHIFTSQPISILICELNLKKRDLSFLHLKDFLKILRGETKIQEFTKIIREKSAKINL